MSNINLHITTHTIDIGSKINHHLIGLDENNNNDSKKILELCQFGKLLSSYFNDYNIIDGNREEPDFIIENNSEKVGVELMRIVDGNAKSEEGYFESICNSAERLFYSETDFPNFLANVYIQPNLPKSQHLKKHYTKILVNSLRELVLTGNFKENEFLSSAKFMNHKKKNICPNFGAYIQKSISENQIISSIKTKEKKLPTYIKNTVPNQWLILIIGNIGNSSFEVNETFKMNPICTDFKRVFLYEDFNDKLFELKIGCK